MIRAVTKWTRAPEILERPAARHTPPSARGHRRPQNFGAGAGRGDEPRARAETHFRAARAPRAGLFCLSRPGPVYHTPLRLPHPPLRNFSRTPLCHLQSPKPSDTPKTTLGQATARARVGRAGVARRMAPGGCACCVPPAAAARTLAWPPEAGSSVRRLRRAGCRFSASRAHARAPAHGRRHKLLASPHKTHGGRKRVTTGAAAGGAAGGGVSCSPAPPFAPL